MIRENREAAVLIRELEEMGLLLWLGEDGVVHGKMRGGAEYRRPQCGMKAACQPNEAMSIPTEQGAGKGYDYAEVRNIPLAARPLIEALQTVNEQAAELLRADPRRIIVMREAAPDAVRLAEQHGFIKVEMMAPSDTPGLCDVYFRDMGAEHHHRL